MLRRSAASMGGGPLSFPDKLPSFGRAIYCVLPRISMHRECDMFMGFNPKPFIS